MAIITDIVLEGGKVGRSIFTLGTNRVCIPRGRTSASLTWCVWDWGC